MFNPDEFMNTQQEAEEFETTRSLIDVGEYTALLEEVTPRTVGENNKPILSCKWKIVNAEDPANNDRLLFDTIWLDMNDNGQLLRGRDANLRLGQVLEAFGLNGKPWAPGMLAGNLAMIQVGTKPNRNTGEEENVVRRIAAAS